jgi:transcriptional regulator GlxA family with amidase domain
MEGLTLTVWMVLTPNVLMLDYAGPAEALRMARDMGAKLMLHTCAPQPSITTSLGPGLSGLEPLPTTLPNNSLILVVGNSDEVKDYATLAAQRVVRWLQSAPRADTPLASICSGALLLAQAGWLTGRRCTTHHSLIAALQTAEPAAHVEADRIFVDDGGVLTSAGITTGIDLALYIVERHAGPELAARVARRLVMYQRRSPQDQQVSPCLAHRNHMHPAVHRAQDAIARDPAMLWTLAALAKVALVSPRHLSRLFADHAGIGVVAYQQQLRIARAKELLAAAPTLSMERVADKCGFGSPRDFRRVWQRFEEGSPADGRKSARHIA